MPNTPVAAERSPSVTLRFMASPTDVLHHGAQGVSGGRVLEWIDKAAYACAAQWSATYCVTAYVGHIHFTRPIPSGHIVEVRSRIAMTGRSSMHIVNEVLSADPREGVFTRACDCLVVFVAKDPDTGKSMAVPSFVPTDDEERRVAARTGTGLRLSPRWASEARIHDTLCRLLDDPSFRANAHGFAQDAPHWPRAAGAADAIEGVLGRRPTLVTAPVAAREWRR